MAMECFSFPTFSRPSGKAATKKIDNRFSQLFILPPQPSSRLTTQEQDSRASSSRKQSPKQNLKHFFRRLLPSHTHDSTASPHPANLEEQLWLDLLCTSSTTPILIKAPQYPSANPAFHTSSQSLTSRKNTTLQNQSAQSTVTIHPPNPARPSLKRDSIFFTPTRTKNNPIIKRRPDSKFSSVSSLPSLSNPTCSTTTTIHLPPSHFKKLESAVRRMKRGLRQQGHLTSQLSNNLIFLFSRKEKQLCSTWRLSREAKQILISELFRVKENTGRAFLRKAVFLQRSSELCAQLTKILEKGKGDREVEGIEELVATLKEDLKTQRDLDEGLRKGVLGKCEEDRWKGSGNGSEGIMVRRFVLFLDGRLGALETCYGRIQDVLEGVAGLVGGEGA